MRKAGRAAVKMNDGNKHVAAAFDGSWQKKGHTSLNRVVTVTSLEIGIVVDVECLAKYCHGCQNHTGKHSLF
jgi:hypothetical protein